jgi:hypothetical protein
MRVIRGTSATLALAAVLTLSAACGSRDPVLETTVIPPVTTTAATATHVGAAREAPTIAASACDERPSAEMPSTPTHFDVSSAACVGG